ncbi:unnamed protein product [Paramecium octaurelia]|uniref:Uncharacterized protein n=1 Tax=Paramecium octaurelia TaxID=43137 RepID=A0A8S1YF62_PAROT|nr:unnamed protein product [Paramecium octaurelia]
MTIKDLSQVNQKNMTTNGNINLNPNTEYKVKVTFENVRSEQQELETSIINQQQFIIIGQATWNLDQTDVGINAIEQNDHSRVQTITQTKGDVCDQIDSHLVELIRQLNALGIANTYNNPKFDDLQVIQQNTMKQIQKYRNVQLNQMKSGLRNRKSNIFESKELIHTQILQKNGKPQDQKAEKFISSDDVDKLRRDNDTKIITFKKLKLQKAVYKFFHNNLYKDVNAFIPIKITQHQPKYLV